MTYMMKKHTTIFQFRPNGIKSLLLMLLLLFVGVGRAWGKIFLQSTTHLLAECLCRG